MLTDNLVLVFVIGGALAFLMILQFFLATRHDQVVSAAGPLQSLESIEERIRQERASLADVQEDLRKRREALQNIASVEADIDALVRQRDELTTEWNSLEQKRTEVRAVRLETEQAVIEKQTADAELAQTKGEIEELGERLVRAEQLLARTEAMNAEHDELLPKVEALRGEKRRLEEAEELVARLEARSQGLEAKSNRLDAEISERSGMLEEIQARTDAARGTLAGFEGERTKALSETAAAASELRRTRDEIEGLGDRRTALEARLAFLEGRIGEAEGRGGGGGAGGADPLRDMRAIPPVLTALETWPESAVVAESDAILRLYDWLHKSGLEYPKRVVRAFHTSMKVNETSQITVLAGISGTGKSQLPRVYSAAMGIGFLQVPVQPRWDSPQDLMGFYNYIEGRFRPTDMAKALWQLDTIRNPDSGFRDRMLLILLDEMNLARVEYYFSDFLSRLESRPSADRVGDANLRKDAEIELEIPMPKEENPPRIFPGYNLLFAGTMNEDESTQSLSDKVVDRANVMRFAAPKKIKAAVPTGQLPEQEALPRSRWNAWVKPVRLAEDDPGVVRSIERMADLMKSFRRPFGHRLGRAIMAYVANYPEMEGVNRVSEALADQVEMRLLPKLRSVEVEHSAAAFSDLELFVVEALQDDTLAEAIKELVESAQGGTGQFVWHGVTR